MQVLKPHARPFVGVHRARQPRRVHGLQCKARTQQDFSTRPFLSPKLHLFASETKGLGFVASQHIEAGELLLVDQPIEAVWGAKQDLLPRALVDALVPHASAAESETESVRTAWMQCLYSGPRSSSSSNSSSSRDTQSSRGAVGSQGSGDAASRASGSGSSVEGLKARFDKVQQLLQTAERQGSHAGTSTSSGSVDACTAKAMRVTQMNAYSAPNQDFAAAHLRGVTHPKLGSMCGLWPVFSIFNHSCAPNTAFFTVCSSTAPERFTTINPGSGAKENERKAAEGGSQQSGPSSLIISSQQEPLMVMHAARDVPAGAELTVTYTGPQLLQPVGARRTHLQESYGFMCCCERCCFEAQVPEDAQASMEAMAADAQVAHEAIAQALGPELGGDKELLEAGQAALGHLSSLPESGPLKPRSSSVSSSSRSTSDSNESAGGKSSSGVDGGRADDDLERQMQRLLWLQASHFPLHSPTVADRLELADVENSIEQWNKEGSSPDGTLPVDIAVFAGARRILQEVSPGSDLHLALAIQQKFCAERLLGSLWGPPQTKLRAQQQQQGQGMQEVVAWLEEGLQQADAAAACALQSRYGKAPPETLERLFWLNAVERLPKPLLQLCWAYRERRLSSQMHHGELLHSHNSNCS